MYFHCKNKAFFLSNVIYNLRNIITQKKQKLDISFEDHTLTAVCSNKIGCQSTIFNVSTYLLEYPTLTHIVLQCTGLYIHLRFPRKPKKHIFVVLF